MYPVNMAQSSVLAIIKSPQVTLDMLLDTGSPMCVILKEAYSKNAASWPPLSPIDIRLFCYLGKLHVAGVLLLPVKYGDRQTNGIL